VNEEKLIARIALALSREGALEGLTRALSPTDLQSLMLHVYRQRSAHRTPAEILSQYERSLMIQPSTADARVLIQVAQAAYDSAPSFVAVEFGPVAPLGVNVVLGEIDQNNSLATIRGAEVMADTTTASALECARRRRAGERGLIKLCARSRQLRLQPFDTPGFSPHFDLFTLVSAGRDRGSLSFEFESLREHIEVYLRLFERLRAMGYAFADIEVKLTHTERNADLQARAESAVLQPLREAWPAASFQIDTEREQARHYYRGFCIGISARDPSGMRFGLTDGGITNWTQRLLSNAKERLFVSGIGLELVAKRFRL
jgi:hypothetical protein